MKQVPLAVALIALLLGDCNRNAGSNGHSGGANVSSDATAPGVTAMDMQEPWPEATAGELPDRANGDPFAMLIVTTALSILAGARTARWMNEDPRMHDQPNRDRS